MKRIIPLLLLLCAANFLFAQNPIRVMSYNVLNFPEPNPAGKEDTLAKILAFHPIDLLLVQEMRFESGVDLILNGALNTNGETRFSAATWVPQQSNPNSSHVLQQMLYYDHEKFTLYDEQIVLTERRDLNNYTLYLNDPDLPNSQDTTWLDIYVIHLKSSQGATNEAIRNDMVDSLFQHIATKPANRNIIVAGDLNVYSSFEAAYQNLLDNGHHIVLEDPINAPGNWNNSGTYAGIHTQSTRTSGIFNDGASGGMDDRFDQALLSGTLVDGTEGVTLIPGSYKALGQSGTCFNGNITDCDDSEAPMEVLRSLYYMSDHLPVVFNLETPISIGIAEQAPLFGEAKVFVDASGQFNISFESNWSGELKLRLLNTLGQELKVQSTVVVRGMNKVLLDATTHKGVFFVELRTPTGAQVLKTIKTR